jgi:hypothetical protein
MAARHVSNDLRQLRRLRSARLGAPPWAILPSLARRLLEAAKPWLIVALFLLVLGLAGGVEVGTVWP